MKKRIIISEDKDERIKFDTQGYDVNYIMHLLSICLTNMAVRYGITKKNMLNSMKSYYEDIMRNEANN